ncbi:hypothetical protein CHS0354_038913 [Potamilus streckersoni]|uniref:Uncharacterized protein n=1 Tax=Potamilus streckersoni TaxID=2493646 RepID=A0AAE0SS40_9BIVA|nr:hypothetical protein CHS0354_038913 [Potamilus streckersoni]
MFKRWPILFSWKQTTFILLITLFKPNYKWQHDFRYSEVSTGIYSSEMRLKTSEIYFSHDTINNRFKNHGTIGSVLDKIYGVMSIEDIPKISVTKRNGKWFTTDNRRLWIFRQLENLGKCPEIDVLERSDIPDRKFTTKNGGVSVTVRGNPESKYATNVPWRSSGSRNRASFVDSDDWDVDCSLDVDLDDCAGWNDGDDMSYDNYLDDHEYDYDYDFS